MKFRISEFCALPQKLEYNRQVVFRLGEPEYVKQVLFQTPDKITPKEQRSAVDGLVMAAESLDCDFAVINPPEYYREAVEKTFSEKGIVAMYPDLGITACGGLHVLGFIPAEHIPGAVPKQRLHEEYCTWLKTHYSTLSEENMDVCPDPWRLFVRHAVRGLFHYRIH